MGLFSRFFPKNPDQPAKESPEPAREPSPPAGKPAAAEPAQPAPAPAPPKPRRSTMRPEAPPFKIAGDPVAKRDAGDPRQSQMALEELAARALQLQQGGELEGVPRPKDPPPYATPREAVKGQAPRPVRRSAPPRAPAASRPKIDAPAPPAPRRPTASRPEIDPAAPPPPRRPTASRPELERFDPPAAPQRPAPAPQRAQAKPSVVDPPAIDRSAALPTSGALQAKARRPEVPAQPAPAQPAPAQPAPARPRATLATLAPKYLESVRSLVIGMHWSEPVAERLGAAQPAPLSLRTALVDGGVSETPRELDELAAALRFAEVGADGTMRDASLQGILVPYAKLAADVPALAVEETLQQREAVIVESLLLQVAGITTNTIDKLRASGTARLAVLGRALPEDLANASGIGSGLASQIVERVKRYRQELREMPLGAPGRAGWERLTALLLRLRQAHDRYQEATNSFDESAARKKQLREARNEALLDIRISMARSGELERIEELERLPFERKIERIEDYLAQIVTSDESMGAPRQSGDKVR